MKRFVIVGVLAIVGLPLLFVIEQAIETLHALTQVERERDTWQRPDDVLQQLALRPGQAVVDLGSGAGYFALKIAPRVAPGGRVLAVDLRRQSLAFLWIRARLSGYWHLQVIRGEVDDPRLPTGAVDAALIANTYHELATPQPVLKALFMTMRSGGTLVVVDRATHEHGAADANAQHEIAAGDAERTIRQQGFEPVFRDDRFIDRATEEDLWWLIVFRKP
jgi:predicted methyltransferase